MDTNGHECVQKALDAVIAATNEDTSGVWIPNLGECYDGEIMGREELARTVGRIRQPVIGDALAKDGMIWAVVGLPRDGVHVVWGTLYRTLGRKVMSVDDFGNSATLTFMGGAGFFPAWGCRP
jgi:hypothetical protein